MTTERHIYEIGEVPPIGVVPRLMYAQVIRRERYGEPVQAIKPEKLPVPHIEPDEVLVYVMAAGINQNNVWASQGVPEDVIGRRIRAGDKNEFHIGGSDASGVVYAVGDRVRGLEVGDEVIVHCAYKYAKDLKTTTEVWGYDTNWGSFAQFTAVKAHQCLPKAKHLTWEESAAPTLVGATTYKMLRGWPPNQVKSGDVVLIWGGAGGLGCMAIQLTNLFGGIPVAVVNSPEKAEYCLSIGAKACIDRSKYSHWGIPPHWKDESQYNVWAMSCRQFGKEIWKAIGKKQYPAIVFEHPGEDTIPTSIYLCDDNGMVVTCAGTSGYSASLDLRQLWCRQKRFQGSHFADQNDCVAFNDLVCQGKITPCLTKTFSFGDIPAAHQQLYENRNVLGKFSALVGAPAPGAKNYAEALGSSGHGQSQKIAPATELAV